MPAERTVYVYTNTYRTIETKYLLYIWVLA